MRGEDLHHKELLELDPEGGVIRFAGQRALLLDAMAMGLLRQYLASRPSIFGDQKTISARIKQMALVDHKIIFEPQEE